TGTNKQTIGNVPVVFPNGDVAVLGTYFDNASLGKNSQQLWMALSKDGGRTFSTPRLVMEMHSLPVPGLRTGDTVPMFAVARDGASAKDGAFMTAEWLTTSTDGGRTWSASRRVTPTFDQAAAAQAGGYFLGDYQGLDAAGAAFQPFFAANLLLQASGALGSDTFSTRTR